MKSEIQSLPERKLRRLSHAYLIMLIVFIGAGITLFLQGLLLELPILQYLGLGTVVLSKSPFDNHRFLKALLAQRLPQ